jgi:hypothetical protein
VIIGESFANVTAYDAPMKWRISMPLGESMKAVLSIALFTITTAAAAASVTVGAAPSGNAASVASRIIKANYPSCRQVKAATRRPDGAIAATCNGSEFLVFTMFNPKENHAVELAMNCTAAKQLLDVSC